MSQSNSANQPYNNDFKPALHVDSTVELQPLDEVHRVRTLEVLPTVQTQEITVDAGATLRDIEMRGLYAQTGVLAQFRLFDAGDDPAIPDGIEIQVDQGGEESPRFNIKNARGFYDTNTPSYGDAAQQTELFQYEDTDLFFTVKNTTADEVTFTLSYTGYAYDLVQLNQASPEDADISVLVERKSLRGR